MKFEQIASGSDGNFYIITLHSGYRLLIECGIFFSRIQKALNYDLSRIHGCLLTHGHLDHSLSTMKMMAAGIDLYGSEGTGAALHALRHRRWHTAEAGRVIRFGSDTAVLPFDVEHDAPEPLGYIIRDDGEHLLFFTDTAVVRQRFPIAFNLIAAECSYQKDRLAEQVESGAINETHARRLIQSHMEADTLLYYLENKCDLSKCRELHLLHMGETTRDNAPAIFGERLFLNIKTL